MARINLLPWRAERRKQRQKDFGVMLGVTAVGALVLAMGINMYYGAQIDGQTERNAYVQQQIDTVDKEIAEIAELNKTKARLLARKEVIEKLQASRSQMVHLFDSLVRTIPDGVVLTSIKQDDQSLTLEGRSQSNARVSTYLRNLEGSGWMTDPQLSVIEAKGEDKGLPYQFSLSVKLADPNAPRDTDGDGVPDAAPVAPAAATTAPAAAPATTTPAPTPAPAANGAAPATQPAAPAAPAPAASTTPGAKS
ncbi:PilN domain-containing protein [Cognatilysobacter terrigena]|uniref:PilN domain-containing protein n=1 Tax=Cognatilysobacter terrigena TaxID=2488749 RepID=UPI001061280D|nr:PilN domain-containing protein [Lysobacter terrigena]